MSFFSDAERRFAETISKLALANPFMSTRRGQQHELLGEDFEDSNKPWYHCTGFNPDTNQQRIDQLVERLAGKLRIRMESDVFPQGRERQLYEDLVIHMLFNRYNKQFHEIIRNWRSSTEEVRFFEHFERDAQKFLHYHKRSDHRTDIVHLFACFFQIYRTSRSLLDQLVGSSIAVANLRASIWHAIFTPDMSRYRRSLFRRMGDLPVLISGPFGTGKRYVARIIGLARYLAFDPINQAFSQDSEESFHHVRTSAQPTTSVEATLFGYKRGVFVGAVGDREGLLETCPALGTVFLEEVGTLEQSLQVKLLNLLETRHFQRLGEKQERRFAGKLIVATNLDLTSEIKAGRFQEDFYYRLCANTIAMPSLREQVRDQPDELAKFVHHFAILAAGEQEAESLSGEVMQWIESKLSLEYSWPGNLRELEQCVYSVMVQGRYIPTNLATRDPRAHLARGLMDGSLTASELLSGYCTLVYGETGSYQETSRRLNLDRRTVKAKVDEAMLEQLQNAP